MSSQPSHEPPASLPTEPTEAEVAAGLHLDRLDSASILAFVQGLPRRLHAVLPTADDTDDAGRPAAPDHDPEHESGDHERAVELIQHCVDRLEALIDRLGSAGYPLDPDVAVARPDTGALPTELEAPWRRYEAATTEAARRIAGIPSGGWASNPDLLDHARATVGGLAWLIGRHERTADA